MLQSLDGAAARRWAVSALAALGEAREEIDALNVFPVPDGDTGTNMFLTLEAAVTAAQTVPDSAPVAQLADVFARGALLGARGNSGVIGAQLLRGWADTLAEFTQLSAASAVEGFRRADEQAWKAVNDPVEGTILSVSRAAADAAAAAAATNPTLKAVVSAAADAAQVALELTPTQLPALARAGVVDAGGRGLVVLIDSLAELVLGASRRRPARSYRHPALPALDFATCSDLSPAGNAGPSYEVMFLLETDPDTGSVPVDKLRPRLASLGDSLVIVGGSGLWQVHVHVHDPGAAVEAAMEYGRPHQIRITHFSESVRAGRSDPAAGPGARSAGLGLVACAAGPGLAELFGAAGAVVVAGGPGRRPSTSQLLAAIRRTKADSVALLPNDGDTMNVAQVAAAAARADGIRVAVLPTRAQVQGLAAAAVHDPARSFDDDVVSMSAAAGGARDGAVTVAVKDGLTSAGECRVGDALGVVDGDFAVVGSDLAAVAIEVVERLLSGGGELVTLVVGVGEHESLARAVAVHLRNVHRQVEVSVLNGGQPRYPLLIGVE
ncbi:MAG TPA: DAK2 domain-containing protein [Kineosporiaceae bacterium]|nr:DAK2 domain-containing protein [Kineosporiaceae bacterium]